MPNGTPLTSAVAAIIEPQLRCSLGDLGFIGAIDHDRRRVELMVPYAEWPQRDELVDAIRVVEDGVTVDVTVMNEDARLALRHRLRERMSVDGTVDGPPRFLAKDSRTRVLGISSGKGGVGKSTVTVNLAIALARRGLDVGVLDADVYGFSVPKMLGAPHDPVVLGDTVLPTLAWGVRSLSMGYFVSDDQPVIWRGPMLHKAVEQLLTEAFWNEPDFLLIDLPPGTGDVALTLSEVAPKIEIYVVTTPQSAAQRVAQRSAIAARKLKLSVRGVIENMSWFTGDDGQRYELFGAGGGARLGEDLGLPLLAQLPLSTAVRAGGDEGRPAAAVEPESEVGRAFAQLAEKVAQQGPARVYRRELQVH